MISFNMGNIDITDYAPGMPPITSRGGMGSIRENKH
jgi:hypothetical protein